MCTTLIYLRREKSDDFVFNIIYLRRKKNGQNLVNFVNVRIETSANFAGRWCPFFGLNSLQLHQILNVGGVLKNSGNFQQDGHKNLQNC